MVDYLLKPISQERFNQSIAKLNSILEQEQSFLTKETILIKSGYEHIKIYLAQILYIKSDSDYTEVHTLDKVYVCSDTLKHWLEKLAPNFCQVHKSYIVNTNHLEKIAANKIFLYTAKIIPIGRAFKKNILHKI